MPSNPLNLTLTPASWHKITRTWSACKDHVDPVRKGLRDKRSITALDVIRMDGQTDEDAVLRALWLLGRTDPRTARYIAEKFARHVLSIFEKQCPDDKRPRQCLDTIRKWLRGKATDAELDAAWAAARAAAWAAAWAAAGDAAWAAARAAARAAAWAAAWDAAGDDAWDAARAAAWAAARDAARAAARAAAWDAAWDAAGAAERKWQRRMITRELARMEATDAK